MNDTLRGNPELLRQDRQHPQGYFGKLWNVDDPELISTDLETTVASFNGRHSYEIPVIVPTLTRLELIYLVDGGRPTWGIIEKAKHHAQARLVSGHSVFAQPGEQHALPKA